MVRPAAVVLLLAVTTLSVGCLAYPVVNDDRDDLTLATAAVEDGLATLASSKKPAGESPEAQSLIELLKAKAAEISRSLARGKLDSGDARSLREGLTAYRDRYAELVQIALADGEHYEFSNSPERVKALQASIARVANHVDRILARLDQSLGNDAKVSEKRIRDSVKILGEALIAYDKQCSLRLEKKIEKHKNEPGAESRIKNQQQEIAKAIAGWLEAVDAQLKGMIDTGNVEPTFFATSKLSAAIKLTLDPEDKHGWSQWTEVTVTIAASAVESFVPEARTIGKDEQWALRIIEEEFAPLIKEYRELHAIGGSG
jgi:hypothetical protein